jgi:hypothetical protein
MARYNHPPHWQKKTSIETREGQTYLISTCRLSQPIEQQKFETMLFLDGKPASHPFDNLPGNTELGIYQRYATEAEARAGHHEFVRRVLDILAERRLI